ncbi:MAG: PAS domain-containing protein [Acidobacteria bacterium]|nr:PAS domain-containing protein [Acidobacteriota bacterium]
MPDRKPRATARAGEEPAPDSFFRDLVWSLRNGVLAVERDGTVAVMNRVAYQILGLQPRPSDIGRPFTEVLKEQQEVCRIVSAGFELSHLPNRAELRLKSTGKVIGYTLSQVRDRRGQVTGATLFFKDLTRVEQLEERERLRDRLAALGEMAAAIAHEVKNPLAGIEVMAGLLKRQLADSADAQSILGDIIKEAKMANAIVVEVLDFVRPIRLQVERVSVADAIRDALSLSEAHVTRGDVRVDVDCPDHLPLIQGDTHQLRQIFTNLLTNAYEALGAQGQVRIHASAINEEGPAGGEPQGPMVQVDVSDNGPGIPLEVVDRIFSPFFTTKPQGSGLGLAIVRKIVDAHDGRIDVGLADGGGTRFRVTLPVTGNHLLFGLDPAAAVPDRARTAKRASRR